MPFVNLITEAKCFLMGWIEYKYVMLNFEHVSFVFIKVIQPSPFYSNRYFIKETNLNVHDKWTVLKILFFFNSNLLILINFSTSVPIETRNAINKMQR